MFSLILCVCTGNVCRSPMAAGLLGHRLGPAVAVASAGTAAIAGQAASEHAVAVMAERGIDIGAHRARPVDPDLLRASDLVLAAERGHVRDVTRLVPRMRGRVYRLGHWRDIDLPDPIGGDREDFDDCLGLIEACVEDWMPQLQPPPFQSRHG